MPRQSGSLDTNVLLRLLLQDVPLQHKAAVQLLTSGGNFSVADTAFVEVIFVLERNYQLTRPQISEAVKGLASLAELNCNHDLLENALPVFEAHPSLSFEDCCLAVYANLNDAEPLWTFDKKLASQAKNARLLVA